MLATTTCILIEISEEYDKVALISATSNNVKHFMYFKENIISYSCKKERYNRNIYVNKLILNALNNELKELI